MMQDIVEGTDHGKAALPVTMTSSPPTLALDPVVLRDAVAARYGSVAVDPTATFPFSVGRTYAEAVGYPPAVLDALPPSAVDAFTGVTYLPGWMELVPGQRVVDLGCGAGVDTLIAAERVGQDGLVEAIDLAPEMVKLTRRNVQTAGAPNVTVQHGAVEALPLPDAVADVVMANGVFNLAPDKERALAEALRVLKPGGCFMAAEIVLTRDVPFAERNTLDDWFR
jgi:arsenite methyltransferase